MNVNSIRTAGIPATRPQERPTGQEVTSRAADTPVQPAGRGVPPKTGGMAAGQELLSDEEQRFFEELYPGAVSELRTSPMYSRTGVQPGQATGTLLDRRG